MNWLEKLCSSDDPQYLWNQLASVNNICESNQTTNNLYTFWCQVYKMITNRLLIILDTDISTLFTEPFKFNLL